MVKHGSSPQPQAVKRINKEVNIEKPSNLEGSEVGKKPSIKDKKVQERNL